MFTVRDPGRGATMMLFELVIRLWILAFVFMIIEGFVDNIPDHCRVCKAEI